LLPSEFLSSNELAAAAQVAPDTFNAQQQRRIDWSPRPIIARAYLDQLERSDSLALDHRDAVSDLLDRTEEVLSERTPAGPGLTAQLDAAAEALARDADAAGGASQRQLRGLTETLTRLAERLR